MVDQQKHILIAEDEANLATSLYFILTAAKYKVTLARNGKIAFAHITSSRLNSSFIDLLITDILMPEMTGEQLLDLLRKNRIEIPTLIMTGYGEKELIVRLMRLGCDDFIDKPFEPDVILQRVESILAESSQKTLEHQQRELMAWIGERTSQVAHDLNNPIGATLGNADLALGGIEPDHPAKKNLERLLASSGRAAEICRGLLAKSQGLAESVRINTEINSLVERAAAVLRDIAPEKVSVEASTPVATLWLKADGERLQQAILNLGFNAFNAMPEGGRVSIKVTRENAANPRRSGPALKCVVFKVEDSGVGIPTDTIDRIFKEGFTTCDNGHGMGLACVRKIVEEEHLGWIEVTSTVGKGTTFTIYIPVLE
jgi:signal transduction histidine kinase